METNLDNWDDVVKEYLKAEHLKEPKGELIVQDVKAVPVNDNGTPRVKLEINIICGNVEMCFMPNWTNTKFIKTKTKAPKDLIGKTLVYEKIKVQNPNTKETVDSISLIDVK